MSIDHLSASLSTPQRVSRDSIMTRVFAPGTPPIVLLQAPAGHGKTTVLRQIKETCRAMGLRCAWIHLEESDNDRRRHATHLRSALGDLLVHPDTAEPVRDRKVASGMLQRRADWLIDELRQAGAEIALFFDEFEVVSDSAVLAFWKDFLLRHPPNVRVFLSSRAMPEVGLARLLVNQSVLLLSAEDLRFSEQEVRQFFSQASGIQLRDGDVETIFRRTEGWPAALQLFRLGLMREVGQAARGQLEQYKPRELAEYVADRVLDMQPADIRDFLLSTSILPRLSAALCDALTGRTDSQSLLMALERSGMFVQAIDSEFSWFRYHRLFSAQLREQLKAAAPARERQLNIAAAQWLAAHQQLKDAMACATASNDLDLTLDIFEQWASVLVADGELATVTRWLDDLPLDAVLKRPKLAVRSAWALVFMSRQTQAAPLIAAIANSRAESGSVDRQEADTVLAIAGICADDIARGFDAIARFHFGDCKAGGFVAFGLAAAANVEAYHHLMLGQLSQAQASLIKARSYNRSTGAVFSGGYTACLESVALVLQGHLSTALDLLQRCLISQRQSLDANFATAPLASCYVWALYEAGELASARAVYREYRDMILECSVPDLFLLGLISMARVYRLGGSESEADAVLGQAEYVATSNGWGRLVDLLNWERLRIQTLASTPANAQAERLFTHLKTTRPSLPPGCIPIADLLEGPDFGSIRRALANEQLSEARDLIEQQREARPDYHYPQLRLQLFNALLLLKRGMRPAALRRLTRALEIAAPGGFVRPFLDEGPEIIKLLEDLADHASFDAESPVSALLERVLQSGSNRAGKPAKPAASLAGDRLSSLTPRELQLLRYVSQRLSNREIAQRATLSENTVKFHLKNIFEKLGVNSRLQAYDYALLHQDSLRHHG